MTNVILICSIVCIMAFGYYVMCRLDEFVGSRESLVSSIKYSDKDVLLFKGSFDAYSLLSQNKLTYDVVEFPSLPALCRYRVVIGLSENDLDNLLVCVSAKRANPSCKTVARCNTQIYREVFKRQDVDAVIFDVEQVKTILNEWKVII